MAWLAREGEEGPTILVHFRDLTEQERLNRMRADFIANASHELRTPIASLLGFIETLQGPAKNDEAAREKFLGIMAVQGKRMTSLIDDLLSLSRVEMNAHKIPQSQVNLVTLLHNTIDTLSPLAEQQNVSLEFEEPEGEFIAIGEEDELSKVFQNLVHNAIKYGKSDGEGYVRIYLAQIKKDKNKQEKIKVIIEDNGIGIASHHIPRLTERFYRADIEQSREKGGTGLGLAITKHIISHHRGELKINSRQGHGSIFSVLLPKA
jgi:two-component system phosphate regulon sensor histidine kinase PhoR